MSEKDDAKNKKGGRRIVYDISTVNSRVQNAVTYVVLKGVVAVPKSLAENLTKKELFIFLQSRGLVAENSGMQIGSNEAYFKL